MNYYKPNREPASVRHPNIQLAVFKKEIFYLDRGNIGCYSNFPYRDPVKVPLMTQVAPKTSVSGLTIWIDNALSATDPVKVPLPLP